MCNLGLMALSDCQQEYDLSCMFTFLAVQVSDDREISICLVENVVAVLSSRLFNGKHNFRWFAFQS